MVIRGFALPSVGLFLHASLVLQPLAEERIRHANRLVKPILFPQKRMRRVFDDRQTGRNIQLVHSLAKCIRAGAEIVRFARDEPARRIGLVQVLQWRREAIRLGLVFQRDAEKLSPDRPAILRGRDVARALRQEIRSDANLFVLFGRFDQGINFQHLFVGDAIALILVPEHFTQGFSMTGNWVHSVSDFSRDWSFHLPPWRVAVTRRVAPSSVFSRHSCFFMVRSRPCTRKFLNLPHLIRHRQSIRPAAATSLFEV